MPLRHGIEVSVVATDLQPLTEYGSQDLGKSCHLSKFVTTRIEAKDGLQFFINVVPQYPFPLNPADLVGKANSKARPFIDGSPLSNNEHALRGAKRLDENAEVKQEEDRQGSGAESCNPTGAILTDPVINLIKNDSTQRNSSAEQLKRDSIPAFPPFDLMASVYIDGRDKPEARQIIFLNPSHPRFRHAGFVFRGRWECAPPAPRPARSKVSKKRYSQKPEEYILVRNWVFKSIPMSIDDLASRMAICSTVETPITSIQSETDRILDDLAEELAEDILNARSRPKPGQIQVHIRRVITGETDCSIPFQACRYASGDEQPEAQRGEVKDECTHITEVRTQLGKDGQTERLRLNTIPWKSYKPKEEIYVKFIFHYTDREKLVKLGLSNEYGVPTLTSRIHISNRESETATKTSRKRNEDDQNEGESMTKLAKMPGKPWTRSMTIRAAKINEGSAEDGEQ